MTPNKDHSDCSGCAIPQVPPQHRLLQDPAFCSILRSRLRTASHRINTLQHSVGPPRCRPSTASHRISRFAALSGHASVPPGNHFPRDPMTWIILRYYLGAAPHSILRLAAFCGPASVCPQHNLISAPPPTASHTLGHSLVRFGTASAPPPTEPNVLEFALTMANYKKFYTRRKESLVGCLSVVE